MLVTSSTTGTVLRLFSVPSGEHLCSFRRGTRPATITSLCFSERSTVLAVGSSSGTVHIFDIRAALRKRESNKSVVENDVVPGIVIVVVVDQQDVVRYCQDVVHCSLLLLLLIRKN